MRKYKKVLKKQTSDIVCDICGDSCLPNTYKDPKMAEYATLEATWGYFSKKDENQYFCEMCESCFDKIINYIESIKK